MDHKFRALVRVDLSCSSVTILVMGCFTTTNYRALVPVIRRARALPTHPVITVDVSQAKHLDLHAVGLLEEACREFLHIGRPEAVRIIAPDPADDQLAQTTCPRVVSAASTAFAADAASAADAWQLAS